MLVGKQIEWWGGGALCYMYLYYKASPAGGDYSQFLPNPNRIGKSGIHKELFYVCGLVWGQTGPRGSIRKNPVSCVD